MAQADAQGFLVEHGLLPNYSLVEDGVRLEAMLTFKEPVRTARTEAGKPDAGDAPRTKWSSEPRVHDRPAEAALTELAPGNAYYVRGYRQVIGGFDLGPTRKGSPAGLPVGLRTWRICRECGHVRTGERAEQDTSPCPRCGGHGIGGRSSVFQVAVPRKVTAHDKRDDARITDDRDTRLHIDQSEVGAQVVALPDRTEPTTDDAPRDGSVGASAAPDTPRTEAAAQAPPPTSRVRTPLFARYDDDLLLDLGVVRSLLPALRKVCTGEQFEALLAHNLPELTRDVLLALRDRADPKEVRQCITEKWRAEEDVNPRDFSRAAQRAVSQAETDDDAVLGALGKSFARARDELIVTWSGEASRFLPEDADETVHRATDLLRHDGPSSGSSGSTAA